MINIQVLIDGFLNNQTGQLQEFGFHCIHGHLLSHFMVEALTLTPSTTMRSKLDLRGT